MMCGTCGYIVQGDTREQRFNDLMAHLKTHPTQAIAEMREALSAVTVADMVRESDNGSATIPEATLRDLPEYRCGQCGETFGTNFAEDEIECAYCDARRCPCCEHWFGGMT